MENKLQDQLLWDSFKNGDREAFRQLFLKYYPPLYLYGYKIVQDRDILEDTIQDLFTELWLSPSRTHIMSVKAYLLRALQYKLLKTIQKKAKVSLPGNLPEEYHFQLSHETLLIEKQNQAEHSRRVQHAMGRLSRRQQEIVYLRFFQDLSYEEISEVMNINYQASRNLLYQALKALRGILAEQV